jgi:hypothetical protein
MPVRTVPPAAAPPDRSGTRIGRLLRTTALIVVVLGVLPIVWHASAVWQVSGCIVSIAFVVRAIQVIWREVFSTHPWDLGGSA